MSALSRLFMAITSAVLAWLIYLQWFYDYAKNLSWFPYLMGFALFSMFLMFLKNIRRGEVGHLELFGADLETEVRQGWYWPPSIAPFMQGFDLTFGFDIVHERFNTLGSIGGNPNVQHRFDQAIPVYSARVNTDSFLRANLDRGLNLLASSIFSIRDTENRVRYYKLGFILYVLCWVAAFFGNIGNHATQVMNQAVSAINSTVNDFAQNYTPPDSPAREIYTRVSVQLDAGPRPKWPGWEVFTPTHEEDTQYHDMVEGKKYFIYSEPSSGSVDTMHITESSCAAIPVGRHVYFSTDIPPAYVVNMNDEVEFLEKRFGFTIGDPFDTYLLEFKKKDWRYVRKNWNWIETSRHKIKSQAQSSDKLPSPAGGGLVCF